MVTTTQWRQVQVRLPVRLEAGWVVKFGKVMEIVQNYSNPLVLRADVHRKRLANPTGIELI